jgi:tripartite-type tricarboxylate transporter receptor subunit TctC
MQILKFFLILTLLHVSMDVRAQSWQAPKTMRLIIPQVAGGGADSIGRVIAQSLGEKLSTTVIVDNRPGANGGTGVEQLLHSSNDGSNLILVFTSVMAINPAVYSKLNYDPLKDLKPLGAVCEVPMVMIANTNMQVNSVNDLIALVKSKPGVVFGASGGNGAFSHLLLELFNSKTGLNITHIPFKGEAAAVQHVMSNQDSMIYFSTPTPVLGPAQSGRLKAIAVTTTQRMSLLANVPSMSEQGMTDVNESFWYGIAIQSSTPGIVSEALAQVVYETAKSNALIQSLDKIGCNSTPLTSTEFGERIKIDHAKYGAIARSVGMKID